MKKQKAMRIRVHPVQFTGVYKTIEDMPYNRQLYGDHRDDGSPLVNGATQKMIDIVQLIRKEKITVVDFGGGNGKMYTTLKQETNKNFDYSIVDLPGVSNNLGKEVSYFTSLDQIDKPVDVLYSDATIYLTGDPVVDNIKRVCSVNADYIVLNRSLLFFHGNHNSDLKQKSFYTWVPIQKNYYNIMEYEEYENLFQSAGYKMVEVGRTFTQRMDSPPNSLPRQIFRLVERSLDDPYITYFDHIFKKKT